MFHLALAVPAAALLYAASKPGFSVLVFVAAALSLAVGAVVWVARAATCVLTRHRPRVQGSAAWFLLTPVCGVFVVGLVAVDAPLRGRWSFARDDFAQVAAQAPDMPTEPIDPNAPWRITAPVEFDVPDRIGTYAVDGASRVEAGVFFHLGGGGIGFSDAGFAHIPGGPPGGLGPLGPVSALGIGWYETITFRSLGDDWYAWDAVQ